MLLGGLQNGVFPSPGKIHTFKKEQYGSGPVMSDFQGISPAGETISPPASFAAINKKEQ